MPLTIESSHGTPIFNQVPGMEVLPIIRAFPTATKEVICTFKII